MTTDETHNCDEKVVRVIEIVEGERSEFYAIRDTCLGYWRTDEPIDGDVAWTQGRRLRAEFDNIFDAEDELKRIHLSRSIGRRGQAAA